MTSPPFWRSSGPPRRTWPPTATPPSGAATIRVGTFSFIIGDEPTYQVLLNGRWHADRPYGTIHRLASNGTVRGVSRACFNFCTGLSDYVRVDTHADNRAMQAAIEGYGFRKCGNIYASSGTLRMAYDYVREG